MLNGNSNEFEVLNTNSIFIHSKYADVIGFLEELQKLSINSRDEMLPETAIRHGINLTEAQSMYHRARKIFDDDRLLLGRPRGSENQATLIRTLDRAYQMSINNPDQLKLFIKIFILKQNLKPASIHFGIKQEQLQLLQDFMAVGCQLIDSSHWQIRASSKKVVSDLKKSLGIDIQVRTGCRQNFHGYDVRVIEKKRKRSDKNMALTRDYYASSGVMKYLGYILMILVEW